MGLSQGELQRIKAELGFTQLAIGAEPTVGITRYFEQIVQPYLDAGYTTSTNTMVAAVASGSPAVPVALTVASPTGFAVLGRVIVDVDDLQETATVRSIVGNTITVALKLAHTGTYPVVVEGGESLVREYLQRCRKVAVLIEKFGGRAGIKKADDVEFFGSERGGLSGLGTLEQLQRHLRKELCTLLFGVGSINQIGGGGSRMSVY